jgi:DivIVA domain-containing protein
MARKKKKEKDAEAASPDVKRITHVDIQQREFRVALRGYHEQDVDQFLDEVTEEIARLYAENKRLRKDLEFSRTTHLGVGGAAEANALLLEAREEAARMLADARAQRAGGRPVDEASGPATPGGSASLGPFISRERQFLQGLADLIQSHAEAVKQDLRRARASGPEPGSGLESPDPPAESPGPDEAEPPAGAASLLSSTGPSSEASTEEDAPRVQDSVTRVEDDGSEWTQYYGAPTAATRTTAGTAADDDEILDLTQASQPPRAAATRGDVETRRSPAQAEPLEEDDTDRSLRELFWGED